MRDAGRFRVQLIWDETRASSRKKMCCNILIGKWPLIRTNFIWIYLPKISSSRVFMDGY